MLDHTYKCIFIHQRKVAGTAIIQAFGLTPKQPDWHIFNDGTQSPGWDKRPSYFVFSAVRNPFDRLVSGWQYLRATNKQSLLDVLLDPPADGAPYRHLTRPQVAILRNPIGQLVTDNLIRFERCQEDFDSICDRIGKPRQQLPRVNVGRRHTDYRCYFDDDTRKLAEAMFRDDLETFGYSF